MQMKMLMRSKLLTFILLCAVTAQAQRQELTLSDNWLFSHDKQTWEQVSVPHDWAISGPFDKKWDLQVVAIEQNGEKEATEKSGRSGALPWIGKGYYKRNFTIPSDYYGYAELVFDGAMAEPTVYVNGQKAGYRPYGYSSFKLNITPFIKHGENLLEVELQNLEESSRWYPGAGIYRPVKLVLHKRTTRLETWASYARTLSISPEKAVIEVKTKSSGGYHAYINDKLVIDSMLRGVEISLYDHRGQVVAANHCEIGDYGMVTTRLEVDNPRLWSPETPYLYKVGVRLYQHHELIDEECFNFGIRTVSVSREGGFQLNGVTRKIKGVCLHHDLGPLGAAVNKAALIRQVKTMKEMGCDAIRTAHNMPSQMQMDICDSLGMMVMAESFDMWVYPKCKNGYARFFKEWSEHDIFNLVVANRNHPSIVMWSIGNEIPEQGMKGGADMARQLQDICHKHDPSRPVTQGMDRIDNALQTGFAQVMDVPGMNYRVHKYKMAHEKLPQGFLLGSETASTVSSRGVYKFPVVPNDNSKFSSWAKNYDPNAIKTADGQCSSYDVEWCSWSNLPDDDWVWQDDYPWVIGEFVWTGYDYLGEPTPYDEYWPSRSSYFGICDLAGLPKDRYYLYRSRWNTSQPTIHLLPHWTWGDGSTNKTRKNRKAGTEQVNRIGQVTPVYCYTNYPEGELFVNGKSQGRIRKDPKERLDRYRLRWNDVKYEPGELKVIVYDEMGKNCGEEVVKTAAAPAQLKLDTWTQHDQPCLRADGDDLAFVTVSLTDQDGTLVPCAQDQLTFEVTGAGKFRAVCNGDATSLEPFTEPTMKLFNGQLVVVVQASQQKGDLVLTVKDSQRKLQQQVTIPVE